jgi:hypothetical protein
MEQSHATPEAAQVVAPEQVVASPAPAAPFPLPVMAGVAGPVIRREYDDTFEDPELSPGAKRVSDQGDDETSSEGPEGRVDSDEPYAYLPADDFGTQDGSDFGDDEGRRPVVEVADEMFSGFDDVEWPCWVIVVDEGEKTQFDLVSTDPFGATYGPPGTTAPLTDGIRDSAGMDEVKQVAPEVLPQQAQKVFRTVAGKQPSDLSVVDITTFTAFDGDRGSVPQQEKVMGVSADKVAELAHLGGGDTTPDGFAWLHLLAHESGGEVGPQTARNLVVGTAEANDWMVMVESLIGEVVAAGTVRKVVVKARPGWVNKDLRIANEIQYFVELTMQSGATSRTDVTFDALSTRKPHLASRQQFRREFTKLLAKSDATSD